MDKDDKIKLGSLLFEAAKVVQSSLVDERTTFCHAAIEECRALLDVIDRSLNHIGGDRT